MTTGYDGTYRGTVVDVADPDGQNRLSVHVPEVDASPVWAKPSAAASSGQQPGLGEEVQVVYEGGDSDHPVWQHSGTTTAARSYDGVYQATVVNNRDPDGSNRLQLSMPDVLGSEPAWADPSQALPEIGSTVSVHFEGGDRDRPVWGP